jgi:non-ribosomal peptide synthetase component F
MNNFFDSFSETAKKYCDKIAVSSGNETITYKELHERALTFGKSLLDSDTNEILPVFDEAGIEWFVKVLGIFYAGKVAVPISKVIPPEREKFILDDINKAENLPDGAALIYYTSGSTGKPKGVILAHKALTSFVKANGYLFDKDEIINVGVSSDTTFDAFILLTLPALFYGKTIYIASEATRTSLVNLHKFYLKNKIDIAFLTTQICISYMRIFKKSSLKTLLTGGEALRSYFETDYDIWNLYGPCEATAYVSSHKLNKDDANNPHDIPIGKAIGENKILLIDGEICITGPQLFAGYLNSLDETDKDIYKTGDLAEYDDNFELRFRGRKDKQIKISGYRIEPGEIEAKIMACKGITAVKTDALQNDDGEYILTALCVGNSDEKTIRSELEKTLPRAMIPANIKFVSEIKLDPRTGKGVLI